MESIFLMNILTLMSGLLPIMGILISRLKIKKWIWLLPMEIGFLALAGFLMSGFSWSATGISDPTLYAVSLAYYPLMMAVMLPLLSYKFGLSKGLALTFMLGFLLTELHEIVGFGRMYLGLWDEVLARKEYWAWFTPLNHLYSVVVATLALRISNYQRTWIPIGILLFILGVLLEILIYPNLGFKIYDVWNIASRFVYLPIILSIFLTGGTKK